VGEGAILVTDVLKDKPFAPADPDTWRPEGKSPSEIESDIEQTRRRMSEDIDAIGEKFSPEHLKQRAKDAVRGAQEAVVEKVEEVTGEVGRKTKEMSSGLVSVIRENPVQAMVAGAALFWLFSRRKRQHRLSLDDGSRPRLEGHGAFETAKEKMTELKEGASEKVSALKGSAGEKAHELAEGAKRAGSTAQNFFHDSPMVAAAGVAVLGAIIGASLPRTRKENELMGSTRDDLVERAGTVASQAKQTFKDKLSAGGMANDGQIGAGPYVAPGSDMGNFNAGAGAGSVSEFPATNNFQG
jgi:ElaB/YqjD/DUF883 family membrane-anchored ribosome-binding protein